MSIEEHSTSAAETNTEHLLVQFEQRIGIMEETLKRIEDRMHEPKVAKLPRSISPPRATAGGQTASVLSTSARNAFTEMSEDAPS